MEKEFNAYKFTLIDNTMVTAQESFVKSVEQIVFHNPIITLNVDPASIEKSIIDGKLVDTPSHYP